jgi:excisionase family DNA binding protein
VKEASSYLGISVWTMRALGWNGEIPEVKIGRRVLYDKQDLDQFIENSKRR